MTAAPGTPAATPRRNLPLLGRPPVERADAARNRRRILAAAAELVATRGVAALSMDEVAQAAGVGVGTVYRRFGDRAGLAYAVIDDRERRFQAAFLSGPPPLGPGADAHARLRAFLHALAERTDEQVDLLLMAELDSPAARFEQSYDVYHRHLVLLIRGAAPEADAVYLADALLAPFAANLVAHQRRTRGMSVERIKAGLDALISGLARSG